MPARGRSHRERCEHRSPLVIAFARSGIEKGQEKIGLKHDQDKEQTAGVGLESCELCRLCSNGKGFAEVLLTGWCHQAGTAAAGYLPNLHHLRSSTTSAWCWSLMGLEGGRETLRQLLLLVWRF